MIINKIKQRLSEMCTHILFNYNGVQCGIDHISPTRFDMWYGDKVYEAKNIESVMNAAIFNGKTLGEIIGNVHNLEL